MKLRGLRKLARVATILPALTIGISGCSLSPKSFKAMSQPEGIKRARAVGFEDNQPDWVAIPTLIRHLDDTDPVVRLTSHEALKRRTKQDFGYIPWAPPEERVAAVKQWQAWWQARLPANPLPKGRRKP